MHFYAPGAHTIPTQFKTPFFEISSLFRENRFH